MHSGSKIKVMERVAGRTNYPSTMTNLLILKSHVSVMEERVFVNLSGKADKKSEDLNQMIGHEW